MGPLLFLYNNDLPNFLSHCQPGLYADDTHLSFASDNVDCIDFYLNKIWSIDLSDWLIANKLTLNTSETEV